MESLGIVLEKAGKVYTNQARSELAARKNQYYQELIQKLTPKDILPGVLAFLTGLKKRNIKLAVGSSSQNSPIILKRIGLNNILMPRWMAIKFKKANRTRKYFY